MKKFKAAIFDMDGTLLDSMYVWRNIARACLVRNNITITEAMECKLKTMGIARVIALINDDFKLNIAPEKLREDIFAILADHYREKSVFKPGALDLLKNLQKRNVATVVLSATPEKLVHLALGKLDALQYFSHGILSCASINYTKFQAEAFFTAAEHLQVSPDEVMVFEDAWYAANTAKKAGFTLGVIADEYELKTAEIRSLADFYVKKSWDEFPIDRFFCSN